MNNTALTVDQTAEYLNISRSTIYRLVKTGELPANKIGGQLRFKKETLDALLAS